MLNRDLNASVTPVSPTARKYHKLAHGQVTTLMTNKYNLTTDNIYMLNKLFSVQYNKFNNSYVELDFVIRRPPPVIFLWCLLGTWTREEREGSRV